MKICPQYLYDSTVFKYMYMYIIYMYYKGCTFLQCALHLWVFLVDLIWVNWFEIKTFNFYFRYTEEAYLWWQSFSEQYLFLLVHCMGRNLHSRPKWQCGLDDAHWKWPISHIHAGNNLKVLCYKMKKKLFI